MIEVPIGKRVFVYWNIHKGGYSIRYRGLVNNWASRIILKDVKYLVGQKGQERVQEEGVKNVHAGLSGILVCLEDFETGQFVGDSPEPFTDDAVPVTYNPYKYTTFVRRADESKIKKSPYAVMLTERGEKNRANVLAVGG